MPNCDFNKVANVYVHLLESKAQPAITCSKVTIKSLEQDVKYVRS